MRRLWLLAPVLLLVLAWLGFRVLREAPLSSSGPTAAGEGTADQRGPDEGLREPAAKAVDAEALVEREEVGPRAPLHGVLRDASTGKPIPEVRVVVTRDEYREVLRTDLEGRFRTDTALAAGRVHVDPTPFPHDHADWYARATGEALEVDHDPRDDAPIRLTADAPPFVIAEGIDGLPPTIEPVLTYVVLPGAEQPGPDGTTWVESDHRRLGVHPRRLADGSLLVSPSALAPRPDEPPRDGSGEAHLEVSSWDANCRWWRSDALSIVDGRILDERVVAHDRTSCAALGVRVAAEGQTFLTGVALTLTPLADLPAVDAPAGWRNFPEWRELLFATAGEPLLTALTDMPNSAELVDWRTSCVPAGEYLLTARHPSYQTSERRILVPHGGWTRETIQLEPAPIGAPLRVRMRWEDPSAIRLAVRWSLTRLADDGAPYEPLGSQARLGEDGYGASGPRAELGDVDLTSLPEGHYRMRLSHQNAYDAIAWPVASDPTDITFASGETIEVTVRNADLVRRSFSFDGESPFDDSGRDRQYVLELFRADGTSAGALALRRDDLRHTQVIAPLGEGWRFELRERTSEGNVVRHAGPWRSDEVRTEDSREIHHVVLD